MLGNASSKIMSRNCGDTRMRVVLRSQTSWLLAWTWSGYMVKTDSDHGSFLWSSNGADPKQCVY